MNSPHPNWLPDSRIRASLPNRYLEAVAYPSVNLIGKFLAQNAAQRAGIPNCGVQDQGMPRRSKGDRVVTTVKLAMPVWQHCYDAAAALNVPLGTYVADVMAAHVNRADLIQELDRRGLFAISSPSPSHSASETTSSDGDWRTMTARLMREVWEFSRAEARRRRVSTSTYVADVIAVHANRADLVHTPDPKELLPLAL